MPQTFPDSLSCSQTGFVINKKTSPNCKQEELDFILFIVQMGATGLPRYTFDGAKLHFFFSIDNDLDKLFYPINYFCDN